MPSTLRTTAHPFEDFRVRHQSELATLYKRTRAASWKITEEQWAAAIYSGAISQASQAGAAEQQLATRAYLSSLHARDLALALAVRSGCSDAIEHLAIEYTSLLRSLAEHITDDGGRVIALTKEVFDELCGHQNADEGPKSLFENFDGRVSLVTWLRDFMIRRETGRPPTAAAILLQPSNIYRDKRTEFLGFIGLLDELGAAPQVLPHHPFASRLWLVPVAVALVVLIVVLFSAKAATTRQSQRWAAPSLSAIADNGGTAGVFRRTWHDVPVQFEQSAVNSASSDFGLGSDPGGSQSRQPDQFARDIKMWFSRADAAARFATTIVSHPQVVTKQRKIGNAEFAQHNAVIRPDPAGRLPQPPSRAVAEQSTREADRSAVQPTASYVEAKVDASRPGDSVFAAISPKIDERKEDGSGETAAPAVAPSNAGASKPITIASAGHLTTWVLTSGGVINRSNDGVRWQPLSSGTDRDLLAGTAPSAEVCWVVGRAGTILRTIDGEQWERIPSPTEADLLSVGAADEYSATVLTADGRRFATDNAGKTWQLARN